MRTPDRIRRVVAITVVLLCAAFVFYRFVLTSGPPAHGTSTPRAIPQPADPLDPEGASVVFGRIGERAFQGLVSAGFDEGKARDMASWLGEALRCQFEGDFAQYEAMMNARGMRLSELGRNTLKEQGPRLYPEQPRSFWDEAPDAEVVAYAWRRPGARGARLGRVDVDRVEAGRGLSMPYELFSRGSNSRYTIFRSPDSHGLAGRFQKGDQAVDGAWVLVPAVLEGEGPMAGSRTLLLRFNFVINKETGKVFPMRLDWIGEDYTPRLLF